MPYCRICQVRPVDKEGGVCTKCGGDAGNEPVIIRRRNIRTAPVITPEKEEREIAIPPTHVEPGEVYNSDNVIKGAVAQGTVRNVCTIQDVRHGLWKWFFCFSKGIGFPKSSESTKFQVLNILNSEDFRNRTVTDNVIVYGRLAKGMPKDGDEVRIYGKRMMDNDIIATRIEHLPDGGDAQFDPEPLPAGAVAGITIGAFAVAILAIGMLLLA